MVGFFYDVAQVLQDQGWLQLVFVEMDGEKAASLLNFDYGGSILVYNSGYDPARFYHLSPGIIVTARSIEHAIALGREKFDFLRGDEVYKYRFGAQDTEVRRLVPDQADSTRDGSVRRVRLPGAPRARGTESSSHS